MKIKFILISLFTTFLSASATVNNQKLDELFQLIEEYDKGMGAISLFYDGKEIYQKSYGYADIAKKQKINADTKFRIGSITKTFTATIIMRLIEEDKLSLNTTLDKFYPKIINADKITVRHLLQHRSGIPNFSNFEYHEWNTRKQTKEELLTRITAQDYLFEADSRFDYSNSNYVLLTWIAEDITGKTYAQLLKEIITDPCKLKNTFVGDNINTHNNEALSYTKLSAWELSPEGDMSWPLGAGFIISTPTDLNTFLTCLFNGKIISSVSVEEMKKVKDTFGLGMAQAPFYEKRGYGHTGGIDGFRSNAFYFPNDKLSVALTSNAVDYPLNDIMVTVLSIYFGREYKLPEFKKPTKPQTDLNKYTGIYSAAGFPLKITITEKNGILIAQATGQPSFSLEYTEGHTFKYNQAQVEMEFIPEKNEMIMRQFGGVYNLKKE